jgi:hypothetical protein
MKPKLRFVTAVRQRRMNFLPSKFCLEKLAGLFRPPGLLIMFLLLFSASAIAQETPPPTGEFIIGASLSGIPDRRTVQKYYDSYDTSGMNTISQYADESTQNRLNPYNLVAINHDVADWISYYSTCYYSRWEAEQNQTDLSRVGVKHQNKLGITIGDTATWHDTLCWSTKNLTTAVDSLIYGPHYRQDNRYKTWAHDTNRNNVNYFVRFRMALQKPGNSDPNRPVCKIKVIYRYREYHSPTVYYTKDWPFLERTLKVGDFPSGGYFEYFDFNGESYKYPEQFWLPDKIENIVNPPPINEVTYNDSEDSLGIQFMVDWLVEDPQESGLTLYVDHIEVFDRDWREDFAPDPEYAANLIRDYANDYSEWNNLRYWYGHDEPYSIDAFMPIRIVDSILYHNPSMPGKHRHIAMFNPYWTWDDQINGDTLLCQYYRIVKPEKLWIDFYPFSPLYPFRFDDAEALRFRFQLCHTLQPGFWYQAQGGGEYIWKNGVWEPWVWRFPDSSELKASVMLALAHGSKGITFFTYDTWKYWGYGDPYEHKLRGLVEDDDPLTPTPLWYLIRDNLVPRLKGKLGKTLLSLNYSGNFLKFQRSDQESPPPPVEYNYLTLSEGTPSMLVMNWHCGFFDRLAHPDDNILCWQI